MNMKYVYKKFEEEQAKKREEYLSVGMSEECIQKIYCFDKQQLARDIAFYRRSQNLESEQEEFFYEGQDCLYKKFADSLTAEMDITYAGRFFWIEELSDANLAKKLKKLDAEDLEILTAIVIEGYTQKEIAKKYGVKQQKISKKIKRIKKLLI